MGFESLSPNGPKSTPNLSLGGAESIDAAAPQKPSGDGTAASQTLLGDAIGLVRDLSIFGGPARTSEDKASEAKSNDRMAEIAADTVAALPGLKTWVGGLARATMLINPNQGISENAGSFALNFVEGAAFNKVSKMMLPGSSLSEFATARLGGGLASEALTNATVGLGFGAVRTGFDRSTWVDRNGNVNLTQGVENLLKGSAVGALVNVPAGFVGVRVGRASSLMLGDGALSSRLGQAVIGAGSGSAAGGVFGGVDAIMQHKSFADTLKAIGEGSVVGAATGGIMGAFPGHNLDYSQSERSASLPAAEGAEAAPISAGFRTAEVKPAMVDDLNVTASQRLEDPLVSSPLRDRMIVPTRKGGWQIDDVNADQWDRLTYFPETPKLNELAGRLSEPQSSIEPYYFLPETAKGPFKDMDEFMSQARESDRQVRTYSVAGHTAKIVVPEEYAQQLDQVRALRLKANEPNSSLDSLSPTALRKVIAQVEEAPELPGSRSSIGQHALDVVQAKIALKNHPFGDRALPEDFIPLLDGLPNPTTMRRLELVDEDFYQDPWYQQSYRPEFKAQATADPQAREVTFYKPQAASLDQSQLAGELREALNHEDSHLVADPEKRYDQAYALEKDGFNISEYSERNAEENRAEHSGRGFLSQDTDTFLQMAKEAPIRTAVIARQLGEIMDAAPQGVSSQFGDIYRNRIQFVKDNVLPEALSEMSNHLNSGDPELRGNAAQLFGYLGGKTDAERLSLMAAGDRNVDVARAAFASALRVNEGDPQAQINSLWKMGAPGSQVQDLALEAMRSLRNADPGAARYANILTLMDTPDNLTQVAQQISAIPTAQSKAIAFENAMGLGRDWAGYQKNLALIVMRDNPSLRVPALEALQRQPYENIKQSITRYTNDDDLQVRQAAQRLLQHVEDQSLMSRAKTVLDSGRSLDYNTIMELGKIGDREAIPLLIQAATTGDASTGEAALNSLSHYQSNFIKFYARSMRLHLPQQAQPVLDAIMNGKAFSGLDRQINQAG